MTQHHRRLPHACIWLLLLLWSGSDADEAAIPEPLAPELVNGRNLIENGGFEQGDIMPDWWRRHPAKDADGYRLLRDTSVAHSGKASALVSAGTPSPDASSPNLQWNRYDIPVEGGSALIVSCYAKAEGTTPFRVGCHFYGDDRRHLGFQAVQLPRQEGEWVYLQQQVTVPDDARQVGFVLYANATGKTWYDDVAVLGVPNAAAVRGDPKIDGKLDDACWESSQPISQFVADTGARLAVEKTRAWIAYDDDALYVAFHCPQPKEADLPADGKRFDDRVEVLLDPDHDHGEYFRISANRRGHIEGWRGGDGPWESGAVAAAQDTNTAWTIEIRIPYDQLAIDLDAGPVWGINLARTDRVHGETVTWSLGGLRDARRFGNVQLKPNLWRFRREAIVKEFTARADEIQGLRNQMREADMDATATAEPERLLKKTEEEINELRRQIDRFAADDAEALKQLNGAVAALNESVAGARRTATEHLFTTREAGPGGFRVAIAHSLQKVPRTGAWDGGVFADRVSLEAARDESESFQLVVIPAGASLNQVAVESVPLAGPGGEIPLQWHRVDYVETIEPKYPTAYVGWWPDPLLPAAPLDVAAEHRQPLWFSVSVPPEAGPGIYRGRIAVRHGEHRVAIPVELRVRNFRLPRPGVLATAFGNYAHVLADGYAGKGDYRRRMPIDIYARWCEFMGRYRLGPKNAGREYVSVARKGDAWQADLSSLSATVGALAPKYYAPYSIGLHRLPSSPQLRKPGYQPNAADWARQTSAIAGEWQRMELPEQAFIYGVDEPPPEFYPVLREAYEKLRAAVPEFPIMQTVNHTEPVELAGVVDIWCPLVSRLDCDFYAQRLKAGDTLWTYVCCGPVHPYANFFIDRPATEHRVLFWQARKVGATGLLYWCVCHWYGLPLSGGSAPCWPDVPIHLKDLGTAKSFKVNGDGVLIYPGPNFTPYPSLRLEIIRDGIEDYEYLALLGRLVEQAKDLPAAKRPHAALLAEAEGLCEVPEHIVRSMAEYTGQSGDIYRRRQEVGEMIEKLTTILDP